MQQLSVVAKVTLVGMIAVNGGVTMAALILQDGFITGRDVALALVSAVVGAAVGGRLCFLLFGHAKGAGWFLALLGAILATAIGAAVGGEIFVIAGTLLDANADLVLSSLFDVAILSVAIVFFSLTYPLNGLAWGVLMVATHIVALRLRKAAENLHGEG